MASAKAIVSTDVGGVRDLMLGTPRKLDGMELFENGILVRRDAGLLALAVRYLLQHPQDRQAMGDAGREFARNRFSQFRLADDLRTSIFPLRDPKDCCR
ncbi:MAG TPA: glycosyltransferase [Terriglobales bacterium]|nr:glycosyltransferase [Terriglobales bacterium]